MFEKIFSAQGGARNVNDTFVQIKEASVDEKGRFYIPESTCRALFGDLPINKRRVKVLMSPDRRVLLIPAHLVQEARRG